jgi:hypothetical protein
MKTIDQRIRHEKRVFVLRLAFLCVLGAVIVLCVGTLLASQPEPEHPSAWICKDANGCVASKQIDGKQRKVIFRKGDVVHEDHGWIVSSDDGWKRLKVDQAVSLQTIAPQAQRCEAEDATLNQPGDPPKSTIDYVPPGFYVVYSPRVYHPWLPGNVGIFVVPLETDKVIVYGTGYGRTVLGDRTPQEDMELVDHVIRFCLGFSASTEIVIVAPHHHRDHVSPEAVHALRGFGHTITSIIIHEGDVPFYFNVPDWMYDGPTPLWTVEDALITEVVSGAGCNTIIREWDSPLGKIRIRNRPEHTPGTMDLSIGTGIILLGSQRNLTCPSILTEIPPHGNVVL